MSPPFVEPQLATLDTHVPSGTDWLHELKYDGYRIEARKAGDEVTLFSRRGLDWTVRFPAIAKAITTLPATSALIDGEAAYVLPSGLTDFKSLQEHIDSADPAIRYFAFDLLSLDGKDLRKEPLAKRKEKLRKLMAAKGVSDFLIYSDHVDGSGQQFFDNACGAHLEGIMSKRADAPYRSGRGKSWLKIKCTKSQEFVIGGFTEPEGRGAGIGALLIYRPDPAPGPTVEELLPPPPPLQIRKATHLAPLRHALAAKGIACLARTHSREVDDVAKVCDSFDGVVVPYVEDVEHCKRLAAAAAEQPPPA